MNQSPPHQPPQRRWKRACQRRVSSCVPQRGALGKPRRPEPLPCPLTEQVAAGDAPLGDGGFHGADGGGEDVGLLEDLGQLGTIQGAEGGGIVLLGALVQLQCGKLVPPGLGIPVLVLRREAGAAGSAGKGNFHRRPAF